jgi:hypothetical protein
MAGGMLQLSADVGMLLVRESWFARLHARGLSRHFTRSMIVG